MASIFTGKTFLLVTGASRGIGKQITKTFSNFLESTSRILLLSRNEENLNRTIEELQPKIRVRATCSSVDFSSVCAEELTGK